VTKNPIQSSKLTPLPQARVSSIRKGMVNGAARSVLFIPSHICMTSRKALHRSA